MRKQREIKPLTGIRGVAAVWVMLYHYASSPIFSSFRFPGIAKGYLCVDLFFVLSGFVLGLRYGDAFAVGSRLGNYSDFMMARVARLYPAYLVISMLYIAKSVANFSGTQTTPYNTGDLVANALLMQSWGLHVRPIIYDSWSVSVEVFAYFVFPILIVVTLKRSWLVFVLTCIAAFITVVGVASSHYGVNGPLDAYRDDFSVLPLLRCVAEFSFGLAAFRCVSLPIVARLAGSRFSPLVILALLTTALCYDRSDLLSLFFIILLVTSLYFDTPLAQSIFGNRLIYHFGQISYSLYLLHPLLLNVVERLQITAKHFSNPLTAPTFEIIGLCLTWFASYLSFRFIERPGSRMVNAWGRSYVRARQI